MFLIFTQFTSPASVSRIDQFSNILADQKYRAVDTYSFKLKSAFWSGSLYAIVCNVRSNNLATFGFQRVLLNGNVVTFSIN